MTDNRRLLELALKGLEAERERIDEELRDIQRQLGTRPASASSAGAQRATQGQGQTGSNLTPAGRKKLAELMRRRWAAKRKAGLVRSSASSAKKTGSNLTPAGRKKLSEMMRKRWAERRKAAAKAGR